jgi:hypothetical protein
MKFRLLLPLILIANICFGSGDGYLGITNGFSKLHEIFFMQKFDLIGSKFGKLTVVSLARIEKTQHWNCLCDCGKSVVVPTRNLRVGHNKSCGCNKGLARLTHGHGKPSNLTYMSWQSMKKRCNPNPKSEYYARYYGRGIRICDRWINSFENFLNDMGERPSKEHTLERNKNNLNYYKENCSWETMYVQQRNKENSKYLEHNGERMIQADWARVFKTHPSHVERMLKKKSFSEVYNYYMNKKQTA